MEEKYVWYASYGSNILKERFMCYIQGGYCHYNKRFYKGCSDKSAPLEDRPIEIPYGLYFGNESSAWEGGGVAFIDPQPNTGKKTLGRMYLITEEQFDEVHQQEGNGANWYGEVLELGTADGYKIKTFTCKERRPANRPSGEYHLVLSRGLKETYPDMDDEMIDNYLQIRSEPDGLEDDFQTES